jgi:uncharacterized protein (TIGR03437 family)
MSAAAGVFTCSAADYTLALSSYLGGSRDDNATSIASDAAGNIYVAGTTRSSDLPVKSALQPALRGGGLAACPSSSGRSRDVCPDAFVAKFSPHGELIFLTYLGGSGRDEAFGIGVDAAGNVYVGGITESADFPVVNPLQPFHSAGDCSSSNPCRDLFVARLNPSGTALVYATHLGGSFVDQALALTVDPAGNAFMTGWTVSHDFPAVRPWQPQMRGSIDGFILKLNPTGIKLLYSTYLGGTAGALEYGASVAADSSGNAYVTGFTQALDFPVLNASQPGYGGGFSDGFVTRISADGAPVYSTYLGGSSVDQGLAIATDAAGNAYVTGETSSTDFPLRSPLLRATSGVNAFITKLDATGAELVFSTHLGTVGNVRGQGIAVDVAGSVWVTGYTDWLDFPQVKAVQTARRDSLDAFIAVLNAAGNEFLFSTRLGGDGLDDPHAIALSSSGDAYLAGLTGSQNLPLARAAQMHYGGDLLDGFIMAVASRVAAAPVMYPGAIVNGASFLAAEPGVGAAPGSIISIFGSGLGGATQAAASLPLPASLFDVSVTVNGVVAPLFFISDQQINAQVPFGLPPGVATLEVRRSSGTAKAAISVTEVSPGIFATNSQGGGPGAVFHADTFQAVSDTAPARAGEFISILCTGLGELTEPMIAGAEPPQPPPETVLRPAVFVGGLQAVVAYSGAAPGFPGVYQLNVQLPANVTAGTQPLRIEAGGIASNTVTIFVQ